jgi:hypothetical protein
MIELPMRICFISAVLFSLLSLSTLTLADMYTFVDDYGVRHYTNVPTDIRAVPAVLAPTQLTVASTEGTYKKYFKDRGTTTRKSTKFDQYILQAAHKYKVDPLLIKAVIKVESAFNQFAVSHRGAQGLMQLMPGTAGDLKITDPFDAYQNISGGTRYLRAQLDTFNGDIKMSLAAYNAGSGRVSRLGRVPRIPETINYIRKVKEQYHSYQQEAKLTGFHAKMKKPSLSKRTLVTSINIQELVTIN